MSKTIKSASQSAALRRSAPLALDTATKGLEIIEAPLRAIVPSLETAHSCRRQIKELAGHYCIFLGDEYGRGPKRPKAASLERAQRVQRTLLLNLPRVAEAAEVFRPIIYEKSPLERELALAMVDFLLEVLGKGKANDAGALLVACANMFNPAMDDINKQLHSRKAMPRHPVILALAVQEWLQTNKWAPSPQELRSTVREIFRRMHNLHYHVEEWLNLLDRADLIVFVQDRSDWESIHAKALTFIEERGAGASKLARELVEYLGECESDCPDEADVRHCLFEKRFEQLDRACQPAALHAEISQGPERNRDGEGDRAMAGERFPEPEPGGGHNVTDLSPSSRLMA
jgi:hypothetical protein